MKHSLLLSIFTSSALLGLTACGGGGSSAPVFNKFDGSWQGVCDSLDSTSSFQQVLTIKGTNATSAIDAFSQANCQGSPIKVQATATLEYQGATAVSNACDNNGEAEKIKASFNSVTIGTGKPITGDATIRALLASQNINVVPAYNLMCLDSGKLLTGDVSGTLDGTTEALRPDEMDLEGFTKI